MFSLGTLVSALTSALLARVESIGGSLALSFGSLVMGYTADERQILLNAKQHFLDAYHAAKAAGADELNAIEQAATSAYNSFANEEGNEFHTIVGGVIDFMQGAFKRLAGV